MNDAFYIAATGMKAQTAQIDSVANNVANASTPAFKRASLRFGDLVAASAAAPVQGDSLASPAGVKIAALQRSFTPGELKRTDDAMAVAISGRAIDLGQAVHLARRAGKIDLKSVPVVRAVRARRHGQKRPRSICLRGAGKCVADRGIVIECDHRRLASAS